MISRSHGILALAASALFTGSVFAVNPANAPAAATPTPAAQQDKTVSPGHEVAHQIQQEIEKFAQDPKSAPDKLFVLNTAVANMFEVQYSQQAAQKADDAQIKQLAQRFVTDHEKVARQLTTVAKELGVWIPQSLPQMKESELTILTSLTGRQFDQEYIAKMNAGHAEAIACFEAAGALSQNAQVKQFATENLPTLKEHWQALRPIAQSYGIMTNMREGANEATPAAGHLPGSANNPGGVTGANNTRTGGNATGNQGTNANGSNTK